MEEGQQGSTFQGLCFNHTLVLSRQVLVNNKPLLPLPLTRRNFIPIIVTCFRREDGNIESYLILLLTDSLDNIR